MWTLLAVVALVATGISLILLLLTKRREHRLLAELGAAQAATQRARADEAQATARVQALWEVERRYRGVMDVESAITQLHAHRTTLEAEHAARRRALEQELSPLVTQVGQLRHELAALTDEEYFADFGLYSTRYDFPTADDYKAALDAVRERQKAMVKAGSAAVCHVPWTVEGSVAKGRKMTNDNLKMMIRAFNGECDAAIVKVTYKNIAALEQRIRKAKERIDRLNAVNRCEIVPAYVEHKLDELRLYHEYAVKKEEERQEQREIKEQMKEEQRAEKELAKAQKQAEEEERRYATALAKAREDAQAAVGAKQAKMARKIAELEAHLAQAQANKERAISQAQLTRSGCVYVISNVGSFGEGVYKIGMTRRLDPSVRVRELGDASVPFSFDVHAFIRSNDAPTLEKNLHRRLDQRRVNLVNRRKEFFRVSLEELEAAVLEEHGTFQLTKAAEAGEYRQSVLMHNERARRPALPREGAVAARAG